MGKPMRLGLYHRVVRANEGAPLRCGPDRQILFHPGTNPSNDVGVITGIRVTWGF
jgi:hypothetical protein